MSASAIVRALLLAALFGVAVLIFAGMLRTLGGKTASAARAAI
jgi:hypothetical protein